jgi:hypothetical protein
MHPDGGRRWSDLKAQASMLAAHSRCLEVVARLPVLMVRARADRGTVGGRQASTS